jgi:alpha-beta hydrolase superfamily lysophospholipase
MQHNEVTFPGHDGLELYCQSWLPNDAPKASLIIVHGLGEHSGRYRHLVDALVSNGYSVHAFDHRGHGRSPGQRGFVRHFSEFRRDINSFIRHLDRRKQLDRPLFLMGHSLGGLIVLDAVSQGLSGIDGIIVSAPALDAGAISPFLIAASKVLSRVWPTLSVKTGLDVSGISRDPDVLAARSNDPLVHGLGTPRLATESTNTMLACFENVDQIQVPVLMIHGTSDRITSPQNSRRFFDDITHTDKTYIAYDGGYHESHNDRHHLQVTADIVQWLDSHLSRKGT